MAGQEYKISDLIKLVYQRLDMADKVQALDVQQAYYDVVGKFITQLTKNVKYDNGVLRVQLLSAALRTELSYKKQSLIDKINETLKCQVVKEIIFV